MYKRQDQNPGLASRFRTTITFEDYTDDEITDILISLATKNDYDLAPPAVTRFREILAATPRGDGFGNGRFARNTLEAAIGRHAWRLRDVDDPTLEQLRTIERIDLEDRPDDAASTQEADSTSAAGTDAAGTSADSTNAAKPAGPANTEPAKTDTEPVDDPTSDGSRV